MNRQRLEQCGGVIGNGSLQPALLSLSITGKLRGRRLKPILKVLGVPAQTRSP